MEKELLIPLLKVSVPLFDLLLSDLELSGGWLDLNKTLIQNIIAFKLEWYKAYEDEKLFAVYRLLMVCDLEAIKAIQSREDALKLKNSMTSGLSDFIHSDEGRELLVSEPFTEAERKAIKEETEKMLSQMDEEEQKEYWTNVAYFWLGFLTTFHDLLSIMVHGKSMRLLVEEAKHGDDDSFVLAVQIDRTVLFLPYFQERLLKAQLGKDFDFLDKLAYRMKNPVIRGKIKRRTLWLVFALLESEDMLEISGPELMYICKELGVYGDDFGTGNLRALRKRRNEYYANRGTRKYF